MSHENWKESEGHLSVKESIIFRIWKKEKKQKKKRERNSWYTLKPCIFVWEREKEEKKEEEIFFKNKTDISLNILSELFDIFLAVNFWLDFLL